MSGDVRNIRSSFRISGDVKRVLHVVVRGHEMPGNVGICQSMSQGVRAFQEMSGRLRGLRECQDT
jgi:hypothetical protein